MENNELLNNLNKFLEETFGLKNIEIELYREAFTHSSNNSLPNNQRLAFLGDAVLRLIIREYFYKKLPDFDKGNLTHICAGSPGHIGMEMNECFALLAQKFELVKYLYSTNLPANPGKHIKLNAEVFEALFGAIYLDKGFNDAKKIMEQQILADFKF